MKRLIPILLLLVSACTPTILSMPDKERLVVEGWIDSGDNPVVMVTTPVKAEDYERSAKSLAQHIVMRARVTVQEDDGEEVLLEGRVDENYLPPYIYTSDRIIGRPGHKYTLKVQYGNHSAQGETTVPEPVPLKSVEVSHSAYANDLYLVMAHLDRTDVRYRFFTKVEGKDTQFYPCILSGTSGLSAVPIMRGWSLIGEKQPEFLAGEVVHLKACTLDEAAWQFWQGFDAVATLGLIPFFPVHDNAPSNLKGAYGYWAGYGVTFYTVEM